MRSEEIRQRFLRFFEARGHTVVPSASLLSADPTTLFIIAGMAPFKPYFLGQEPAPYARATSVQKCVRTQDIDVVGTTARHVTFFQMAGNFAFGDYFKERAIPFAWELLTAPLSDGGFGFAEDRLWATVYHDDDEAADIWTKTVGVPVERVQRRGKEDNYWSMGGPGPCGPCSEIYYDRGPSYGREGGPIADEDRYLEVWNLVFMQYERGPGEGYDYPILGDLPAKNIDTGLGVDRMATVLQGVDNIYETDLLRPVLDAAGELAGVKYGVEQTADVRLRIIADHTRTATMLLADGVVPSNEGRGYVLRRLLRRVVRNMRLLGYAEPAMATLAGLVRDTMGPSYPELVTAFGDIETAVAAEEESFRATLAAGEKHFARIMAEPTSGAASGGSRRISGADAFTLHDTYGFPVEITLEMAAEAGLSVDEEGFARLMAEQRRRAREDRLKTRGHADVSAYRALLGEAGPSVFTGYDEVISEATVRGVLHVERADTEVEIVLDRTPFYAESGGQLADTGLIRLADGTELEVYDVQKPVGDLIVHRARVRSGDPFTGAEAVAEVDIERRRSISRSHTATHLVHQAIRSALGESAAQAGSLNAPGRLRFDFSSPGAVPASVLADVEQQVNEILVADLPVRAFVTTQDEARKIGAIALFGEKYGDAVRVVEVGDYARELCGGTHAQRSGQLGLVKLLGESSIAAGTRRVDGLVGLDAFRFLAREHVLLNQLADQLKARPEELPERVAATVGRLREAEKELERIRAAAVLGAAAGLAANPTDVFGVAVVTSEAPPETTPEDLRQLALDVRSRIDPARPVAVAVGAVSKGRPVIVVAVNDTGRQWGLSAGALIRGIAPVLGGGGGGKDDFAQGGGTEPAALGAALAAARDLVGRRVTGG
jgi:alanyl-tRNA synthetase